MSDDLHRQALEDTGFWGRKGAGCLIMCETTGRFLIPKRSPLVLDPETWGVFGGAVDPDENERQAVVREVQEEAGVQLKPSTLEVLYTYTDKPSGFKYTTYFALVKEEFTPLLNWESMDAKWFPFGEWPQPLHFGLSKILNNADINSILKKVSGIATEDKNELD